MKLRRYFGLLYGILVLLLVAIGVWWVVFLTNEGHSYERSQLDRMAADSTNAVLLIRSVPEIRADPTGCLGDVYPHLVFGGAGEDIVVGLSPEAIAEVKREAGRRQRMFTAEGIFFLLLLAAGSIILTLAYRSEREFRRARELFLAGATHELKTPLASLRLYTETLGREEISEAGAARIRERMLDDLKRLETLLEQILALGHDENASENAVESLDLGEEVGRIVQDMESYLSAHNTQIEVNLPRGHGVAAPRSILALVVRNLINNAVTYSPAPAKVRICLERQENWLRLSVQDWGPGIPHKYHEKIFGGFVRVDDQGGLARKTDRAGLGLYLVQRQTRMMGGRVELKSEVGKGSIFTLVLPAFDGKTL